jgi:hypothetical protein
MPAEVFRRFLHTVLPKTPAKMHAEEEMQTGRFPNRILQIKQPTPVEQFRIGWYINAYVIL